jgi:hypothetical protein
MPQMAEFTESLLAHIEDPGLEINILFRKVSAAMENCPLSVMRNCPLL